LQHLERRWPNNLGCITCFGVQQTDMSMVCTSTNWFEPCRWSFETWFFTSACPWSHAWTCWCCRLLGATLGSLGDVGRKTGLELCPAVKKCVLQWLGTSLFITCNLCGNFIACWTCERDFTCVLSFVMATSVFRVDNFLYLNSSSKNVVHSN
jgi:hypothetical protein